MSSFKSNENIHKKEDGSYYVVSANKASITDMVPFINIQSKFQILTASLLFL